MVGYAFSAWEDDLQDGTIDHIFPARDTILEANAGTVVKRRETGTVVHSTTDELIPTPCKLTAAGVGPFAP